MYVLSFIGVEINKYSCFKRLKKIGSSIQIGAKHSQISIPEIHRAELSQLQGSGLSQLRFGIA